MMWKDFLPTTVVALCLIVLGFYILKTKNLHVLIGYNADFIKGDRRKIANKSTLFIFSAALLTLALPLLESVAIMAVFIVLAVIFGLLLGLMWYLKKQQ
ncbi:hypothetical protein [Kurthia sibirica]|uniref:DUF3784 domain-containing protein n=1 Tax=Kurthia sibirica TaxID=202750 RepID=A0A2U3AKN0_9BACL|nr:hypothetical protein [Kurthia sibirica]PWI25081.1 hypothetical protein DEX24_10075 [Kurthia sibirica]GEK33999.1 hypothetical protein KSI01_15320 [Kurthia sibirica]